jgi:hypothetical protein
MARERNQNEKDPSFSKNEAGVVEGKGGVGA